MNAFKAGEFLAELYAEPDEQMPVATTTATAPGPTFTVDAGGPDILSIPEDGCLLDVPEPSDVAVYNEECWASITDADKAYLLGPREQPAPCSWCGGRTRHGAMCAELHRSWEPVFPFGKHAGKGLSVVPDSYLQWLLHSGCSLDSELKQAITRRVSE